MCPISSNAGSSVRSKDDSIVSKVHKPWWCPSAAPRMSNGVAVGGTSARSAVNTISGLSSMNRRMSQAQAARSTWTPAWWPISCPDPGRAGGCQVFDGAARHVALRAVEEVAVLDAVKFPAQPRHCTPAYCGVCVASYFGFRCNQVVLGGYSGAHAVRDGGRGAGVQGVAEPQ